MYINKIKYCFLLFFIGNIAFSYSQSISRSVISSNGRFVSNASGSLSSNAGEIAVTTLFSTNNILTEGFVQPVNEITTGIKPISPDTENISLYPNPATDNIYITTGSFNNSLIIEIYDVQGRKLILNSGFERTSENSYSFNIISLDSGIYFMKIIDKNTNQSVGFIRLVKI
jgi:hypothetical protein